MSKRIAIVGGDDCGHPHIVRGLVQSFALDTTVVLTSGRGVCGVADDEAQKSSLPTERHYWKCKPHRALECGADLFIVFMDGHTAYIPELLRVLGEHKIPVLVCDRSGNLMDFGTNLSYLKSAGEKMPATQESTKEKKQERHERQEKPWQGDDAKLRVTLVMPEALYTVYESQAKVRNLPYPETAILDRLKTCAKHGASRPLYFDDRQREELEKLLGGRLLNSPEQALERIRELCAIEITGGVKFELDAKTLARCASRAQSERTTTEKWIEREAVKGIEIAVGLR